MSGAFYPVVVFLFGLVIGSFLNVVIYRLHTGKSLNDRSHCLSCGHGLSWYELFPLLSYLFLRGRCRHCGCFIPYRYFAVELLTGLAFLLAFYFADNLFALIIMCLLLSALIVGAVYDLYHLIIPDEVSFFVAFTATAFIFYEAVISSSTFFSIVVDSVAGGVLAFGVFGLLWLISHGTWMGFADAKLAFGLGLFVGLAGTFSFLVLSFWIGAITSLTIIFLQYLRRKLLAVGSLTISEHVNMKSEVPFAPFLIAAFLMVFFAGVDVLSLSSYVVELVSF